MVERVSVYLFFSNVIIISCPSQLGVLNKSVLGGKQGYNRPKQKFCIIEEII